MSKKNPLVSQHLENISREALEKYQDIVRRYVRNRQGVYALYRRNKLYYIGLASNLRSRFGDCEGPMLRPGNDHSAEWWKGL